MQTDVSKITSILLCALASLSGTALMIIVTHQPQGASNNWVVMPSLAVFFFCIRVIGNFRLKGRMDRWLSSFQKVRG